MPPAALFGISVGTSFLAWGAVARSYIWPALQKDSTTQALKPILLLHGFRFLGLVFVLPGVVSPDLPAAFAQSAAYGDFISAILALLALATLGTRAGTVFAWTFNTVGLADLLLAFYQGNAVSLAEKAGLLGAGYFNVAIAVPILLITHVLAFRILVRTKGVVPSRVAPLGAHITSSAQS